jgi:hypothetical protein
MNNKNLNTNTKTKKMPKESLTWLDPQSGNTFHAGVAFYDEEYGEYRLVLDAPKTVYSLKPVTSDNDNIKYKVYYPILVKGKFSHKVEVGHGYSNSNTDGNIYIIIGRYAHLRLTLSGSKNRQAKAA